MKRASELFLLLMVVCVTGCESTSRKHVRDDASSGPTQVPVINGKRSASLERDLRIMWSVGPIKEGRGWAAATDEAIDASERVFNTIELRGVPQDKIGDKLKFDLRSKDYGYYMPFWPVGRGVFPIRIDNGNFGWQYDVYFDSNKRISKVLRRWIH